MLVPADEEDAAESGGGWQRGEQTPKVKHFAALPSVLDFQLNSPSLSGFPVLCACSREHAQAPAPFLQPGCVLVFVKMKLGVSSYL
jgi:hypothetical protein